MIVDELNEQCDLITIQIAKYNRNWQLLNEVSLSRVHSHVRGRQFGIITNHRASQTPEQNRRGFYELKKELHSRGLGGITMLGRWQECQDPNVNYDDCPPEMKVDATEYVLFVPNIDYDTIMELCRKYNQDGVIYRGPETQWNVALVFKDGTIRTLGEFKPNKIASAYTELMGGDNRRTFVFEYVAQTYMDNVIVDWYNRTRRNGS